MFGFGAECVDEQWNHHRLDKIGEYEVIFEVCVHKMRKTMAWKVKLVRHIWYDYALDLEEILNEQNQCNGYTNRYYFELIVARSHETEIVRVPEGHTQEIYRQISEEEIHYGADRNL